MDEVSINNKLGSVEISSNTGNSKVVIDVSSTGTGKIEGSSKGNFNSSEVVGQTLPGEAIEKSNPGAISFGDLLNVGIWANSTAQADRILVQLAGAKRWTSMLLSEISSSGSSGMVVFKNYWSKEEIQVVDQYLYVLDQKIKSGDSDLWAGHKFPDMLDQPVKTDSDVQFNRVISKILQTAGYTEGINGFFVDEQGHIKARSLALTDFLETPELRYNKVTVIGEEQWATTGGVIEDILIDGNEIDNKYRVKLKLEESDINPFFEGDICKGIFNTPTGFRTVFFNVVSSSGEPGFSSGIMDVVMTGYMVPPQKAMTIARVGNLLYDVIDGKTVARYPERQRSMLISAKKGYVQWYDKVDTWDIQVKHIVKHEGECKNVGLPGVPLHAEGYISWGTSVYIKGNVTQIDVNDNVIPEVTPVEDWIEGKRYIKNNQVSLFGCIYLCVADFSVTKPKYDNPDWFMTVGDPNFIMEFDSSEGWTFIGDNIDTIITATVTKYNQDITSDIPSFQISWTRASSDPDSDIAWNQHHIGVGNMLHITRNDLPGYGLRKITFTCMAVININDAISKSFSA